MTPPSPNPTPAGGEEELRSRKEQLHRLIIENRDEDGNIPMSDQSAMTDEILTLMDQQNQQAVQKARIDERKKIHEEIYHLHMAHDWNEMSADTRNWLEGDLHNIQRMEAELTAAQPRKGKP